MPAYPTSSNNLALFIRGIGNADSVVITKDPTVGLVLRRRVCGAFQRLLADLSELERVEILRGPRAPCTGATAPRAINFINAKPTGELGFKQTVGAGNLDSWRATSHLNLPRGRDQRQAHRRFPTGTAGWITTGPTVFRAWTTPITTRRKTRVTASLRYDGVENLLVDYSYSIIPDMTTAPGYFQYARPAAACSPA